MDMQLILTNAVGMARQARLKNSPQMLLGELIIKLENFKDKEKENVRFDFEYVFPTGLDSWRGSYAELAINFAIDGEAPTIEKFLSQCKEAVGKTYQGYKGGDFVMGKQTPLWVANYGNSGDTALVGVREHYGSAILEVAYCEF